MRSMLDIRFAAAILLPAWIVTVVKAAASCTLCATQSEPPKWWSFVVLDGRTCAEVYTDLGNTLASDPSCAAGKAMAQNDCCGDEEPEGYATIPVSSPTYSGPYGDEPDCPICGTDEYPGIPGAIIVARYVGEYTCSQLYNRGLNGLIPEFMCGPLQDFAAPVCGCGRYNPDCISNSNLCYGSPAAAPAGTPTQPAPSPTISDRKTPPDTGKYSSKLATGRGGAASTTRGGRREAEDEPRETVVITYESNQHNIRA